MSQSYRERTIARLMSRVMIDPKTKCWNTSFAKIPSGYHVMGLKKDGAPCRNEYVHRVSYMMFTGEIPPGMLVMHICDNPSCCNPAHLQLGTHADNHQDRMNKGRGLRGYNKAGLSLKEVKALRAKGLSCTEIGRRYGVSHQNISDMLNQEAARKRKRECERRRRARIKENSVN